MATKKKSSKTVSYPKEVVEPVKQYLGSKLTELEKRKKQLTSEDPFSDTTRVNDNAAIDADAAEQFGHLRSKAMRATVDRTTIQIRKALSRIKIGKFGVCENCGKFIDTDRLMIMPETTLCIDCEKKREKK